MQPTRMRRPRRHRWLTLTVFFVAYSVGQVVFSATTPTDMLPQGNEESTLSERQPTKIPPKKEDDVEENNEEGTNKADETTPAAGQKEKVIGDEEEEDTGRLKKYTKGTPEPETEGPKKEQKEAGYVPETKRRGKRNCTPPAIEQFPRPLMGQNARKHGGLVIHILVAVFTFIGLAIVCDEYFVSSLDRICEELQLAPDVAGATFMAAGSSAPELATVIIGVFCAQDDIGVSGVIGSAVFNIMFVISVCALCAGTVSHLNWWPLCRDCFFYAISILVMLCTICNGVVSWPEALFMLIMYCVYCVALRFNSTLERWALTLPLPFKLPSRDEQAALVTYSRSAGGAAAAAAPGDSYAQVEGQTKETTLQEAPAYNTNGAYDNVGYNADPAAQTWDPNASWGEQPAAPAAPASSWGDYGAPPAAPEAAQATSPPQQPPQPAPQAAPAAPAYYKAKEYNPETAVDPLVKPIGATPVQLACWYVAFPVHWACRRTMPDCRGRWYPVSFLVSMLWISFYSYFMVWMITIIGYTLGIPDTVMGLTFVAAGVSVPDALSSLAVIKEGYGDMAVSNAVGSNVFDILVCLGLPWFIQTAIIQPGSQVNVISKGLVYSTFSLFSTVVFLVVATHANGWKLDRKYGVVLMIWYLLFITFASLYELNIFGNFNPPDCISAY
ncbi:probable sodium/potassium/calcium exchanger CG1090 isoform X1 [Choristoneura fumiferana]|uniref:probable sodium/potassium/calcium exchanger CG1090 isoform X1 n=2 Tax=Choristoneura fumiferana TaxID=7141 RepID=UPI003D15CDA6